VDGKELRKISLPVVLYGGISDTHYLFNGKVKKVMEKSVKRKRFWYLASVCSFTGEEKEQKDFWYFCFWFL
jgi:hypothetical protein